MRGPLGIKIRRQGADGPEYTARLGHRGGGCPVKLEAKLLGVVFEHDAELDQSARIDLVGGTDQVRLRAQTLNLVFSDVLDKADNDLLSFHISPRKSPSRKLRQALAGVSRRLCGNPLLNGAV